MKINLKVVGYLSSGFVIISVISLLYVALMAFSDPQKVMDLVGVDLTNTDAYSSIRGVYGGVGLTISLFLLYLLKSQVNLALAFLAMLWGFYAFSRLLTIFIEGSLGAFGKQWIVIEFAFFLISSLLLIIRLRQKHEIRMYR